MNDGGVIRTKDLLPEGTISGPVSPKIFETLVGPPPFEWTPEKLDMVSRAVGLIRYKEGWSFDAVHAPGLTTNPVTLQIKVRTTDSLTRAPTQVLHNFPAPPFRDEAEFVRWIFEQVLLVERHEAMEFFRVGDAAPFFPDHDRPYDLVDRLG